MFGHAHLFSFVSSIPCFRLKSSVYSSFRGVCNVRSGCTDLCSQVRPNARIKCYRFSPFGFLYSVSYFPNQGSRRRSFLNCLLRVDGESGGVGGGEGGSGCTSRQSPTTISLDFSQGTSPSSDETSRKPSQI
jgi:hypothetical protein